MSTLKPTVLIACSLLFVCTLARGQQPAVRPAAVTVASMEGVPIEKFNKPPVWQGAPAYLQGATLYIKLTVATAEKTSISVNEGGLMLLSTTWDARQPLKDYMQSKEDLIRDGWVPIAQFEDSKKPHVLFRRVVKAGDKFEVRTRFAALPRVIIPAADQVATIVAAPVFEIPAEDPTSTAKKTQKAPIIEKVPAVAKGKPTPPKAATANAAPKQILTAPPDPNRKLAAAGTLALSSTGSRQKLNHGLLLREIGRQALLITARDELNLPTRDYDLREELTAEGGTQLPVELGVMVREPRSIELLLLNRHNGMNYMNWVKGAVDLPEGSLIEQLVTHCDALSRKEFIDALKAVGLEGKPPAKTDQNDMPAGLEEELAQMSIFTQFSAIRRVHRDIREKGETPQRLAALVRGYANLSLLTDFLWSPAHKVFKARSLLYAERLLNRAPNTAGAFWYRAYAHATTGLHQSALDDLEAARKVAKSKEPRWVDIIDAFCRFDSARLTAAAAEDQPTAKLAALLQFLSVQGSGDTTQVIAASQKLLESSPDCFRAFDLPLLNKQLGLKRMLAGAGFQVMQAELHKRLKAIPDLPENVRKIIDDHEAATKAAGDAAPGEISVRPQLVRTLIESGRPNADRNEPSWQVLGKLIDELSFVHVWRVIDVQYNSLGTPAGESVKALFPLIADHPYAEFINAHQDDHQLSSQALLRLIAKNDGADFTSDENPMFLRLDKLDHTMANQWHNIAFGHDDEIYGDMPEHAQRVTGSNIKLQWARRLMAVSPYSPQSAAVNIEIDWETVKARAAEWEKSYAQNAAVLTALGKRWQADGQLESAERCLSAAAKLSPDQDTYSALAQLYYAQQNYDKWLATLEKYLAEPSYGLGHAQTRVKIAEHFMRQRDWTKAQVYAQEAAQSGAAWAIMSAAACSEVLHEWPTAEQLYQAIGARYGDCEFDWYFFCKRTGQGDLAAAHQMALRRVQRNEREKSVPQITIARFHQLNQEHAKALEILQENFKLTNDPGSGLYAALLADQLKNAAVRDQLFDDIAAKGPLYKSAQGRLPRTEVIQLAAFLQADLKRGGKADFDVKELDGLLKSPHASEELALTYMAACYFDQHGKPDLAVEHWKRIMADPTILDPTRTMAGAALWDRAVTPDAYKSELQGTKLAAGEKK